MAITGINNSSYTSYYASNYKNTVKKTDSEKDSTNTKDGNVTTSTVELKTSRPGVTKTEQIKTGYSNVNDYSKYLQGKYHYMNTGTTSMQGVPTTVSVSSAFLQKCMNDPEKAKYLEENLAAIPDCAKSAVNGCLGTLTNLSYKVDENGNISVAISGTNDPDGKIAKENAERKAKENREKEEKVKEIEEKGSRLTKAYDMIITSYEHVMPIGSLIISGNTICGYTESKKIETAYTEQYIRKTLANNYYEKISVKIFQDYKAYINRVESMNVLAEKDRDNKKHEEGMRDVILTLSM